MLLVSYFRAYTLRRLFMNWTEPHTTPFTDKLIPAKKYKLAILDFEESVRQGRDRLRAEHHPVAEPKQPPIWEVIDDIAKRAETQGFR